jgi:hypothetical protein
LSLGLHDFAFYDWPTRQSIMTHDNVRTAFAYADNMPVAAFGHTVAGTIPRSYFDDFYNRIHLNPPALDLGNLAGGATRTVDLWNAFLTPQIMGSFDPPDDPGIQVIAPVTAPYTIPPLALLDYQLTFTTDSAPTIDDEMRWIIGGVEYTLPITGRRVVAWPFLPTWDRGVDEQLEWLTSVERSYDGTEQRISLRTVARRAFEFTVRESRETAQHLENALYGWAGRLFAMPIFPEKSTLTAPAVVGATTLQCATADRTFVVDGLAVLYGDDLNLEVVEVASVTPTAITTSRPTTISWAAGTRIYPAMIARVDGTTSINRQTDSVLEAPIRMVGSPGDVDPRIPTVAAPATYLGDELYTLRTNWAGGVPFDLEAEINQFDSGTGRVDIIRKADTPIAGRRHRWTLKTAAEMAAFRAWLGRRKGQAVPVWMPTGNADLTLAAPVVAASSTMVMKSNRFEQFGAGIGSRKHIFIQLRNGAYLVREIVAASALPNNTLSVVVGASLGVDLAPEDIKAISFLQLWRLASDNVVIAYVTDKVAVVEAVMRLA